MATAYGGEYARETDKEREGEGEKVAKCAECKVTANLISIINYIFFLFYRVSVSRAWLQQLSINAVATTLDFYLR